MRSTTLLALFILAFFQGSSQINYQAEKDKLFKRLTQRYIGPNYDALVKRFYTVQCDSLVKNQPQLDGESMENVLVRLFGATQMELDRRTLTALRVPSLNSYFLETVTAYQQKKSIAFLFRDIGVNRTRILANAFIGHPIGDTIKTYAALREMIAKPYLIPKSIGEDNFRPYRDTLLHYYANMEPLMFLKDVKSGSPIKDLAASNRNRTVQAILALQEQGNLNKILPFALSIEQGRTTPDSVMKLASKPSSYLKAYTAEVIRLHTSSDPTERSFMKGYIDEMNAEQAKIFIDPINQLHESPDKVRYYMMNELTADELYLIIVGGRSVFYTSSFLFTFNRFIELADKEGLEKFFDRIQYYQFGEFLSAAAAYGMINKLMKRMKEESFAQVLSRYIRKTVTSEQTDRELIVNSMVIAEVLHEIRSNNVVKGIVTPALTEARMKQQRSDVLVQRIYQGFGDVLMDSMQGKMKEIEAIYDVLHINRLKQKDSILQVAFFYDDTDGLSSFNNYMSFFPAKKWSREDQGNYLILRSVSGNPMTIYLNKPNTDTGDIAAQNQMLEVIQSNGLVITSFLHRGHSYHLFKSLKRLPASAEFVYLGSCGGYNDVFKVFQANPDAHIISTRNVGSRLINDPVLSRIADQSVANEDIEWNKMWADFERSFTSKNTKELFSAYIPPNKYIGIIFIREVFNF